MAAVTTAETNARLRRSPTATVAVPRHQKSGCATAGGNNTRRQFHSFLLCDDFNPQVPGPPRNVCAARLSHYYFYTGHTSYLTGNQLNSKNLEGIYMGDGWQMDFKQRHFDKYGLPDFYSRVGTLGVLRDSDEEDQGIENNMVQVWEEFTFDLTVLELALLRVEVHEYDMSEKDELAQRGLILLLVSHPQVELSKVYHGR
ncbi:hypothetical protein ACQ4PT_042008 [Festuca glaucescens]